MKRLIMILSTLVMMLAFQNCGKVGGIPEDNPYFPQKPSESDWRLISTPLNASLSGKKLHFGELDYTSGPGYALHIDVDRNYLQHNHQRVGCSVANNEKWLELKSLIDRQGLCQHSYEYTGNGSGLVCMAIDVPFARIDASDDIRESLHLGVGTCNSAHINVCDPESRNQVRLLLQKIAEDFNDGSCSE